MPRKTAEQKRSEALAARPFAFGSTAPYAAQSDEDRESIAQSIAADRAAGLSGDELRAKYGDGLTGPARRRVLREFGFGGLVAPSYVAYRDGDSREGTRHAREHGARAAERRAEQERIAAEAAAKLAFREQGAALRAAGIAPSRSAGKRAEQFAGLVVPVAPEQGTDGSDA